MIADNLEMLRINDQLLIRDEMDPTSRIARGQQGQVGGIVTVHIGEQVNRNSNIHSGFVLWADQEVNKVSSDH